VSNVSGPAAAAQRDGQPGNDGTPGIITDREATTAEVGPQATGGNSAGGAADVESETGIGPSVAANAVGAPTLAPSAAVALSASSNQGGAQALAANPNVGSADPMDPGHATSATPDAGERPGGRVRNAGQGDGTDSAQWPSTSEEGHTPAEQEDPAHGDPRAAVALLAEMLPIDLSALERALDHCLGQIDAMGETLEDLRASDGVWPWLAGAVVASTAGAMACHWQQRTRYRSLSLSTGEGAGYPWFPEPIGSS